MIRFPILLAVCAAMLPLAGAAPAAAGASFPPAPERTDKGSYQGSWLYRDGASKLVFWIDAAGRRNVKVRYRYELRGAGGGDSGEKGTGPSTSASGAGTLGLTTRVDPEGILRGRIVRRWERSGLETTIANDLTCYRIELGDRMHCAFTNMAQEVRGEDGTKNRETLPDSTFTFARMTDELVFWEEL